MGKINKMGVGQIQAVLPDGVLLVREDDVGHLVDLGVDLGVERNVQRLSFDRDAREVSLQRDELYLVYQPKRDLVTPTELKFEALIRQARKEGR